jgi:hypothetical protein
MRVVLLVLAFVSLAAGQMSLTVAQLKQFMHSSVERKYPDKQVVRYLKQYKLSEQLSDRDLMEMISQAPGPETADALKQMQMQSMRLPPPPEAAKPAEAPKPVPRPAPPLKDQERIIEEAREVALSYTKKLPDFICLQYTRRLVDRMGNGYFQEYSTLAERLSYFDQKEEYKFISENGSSSTTPKSRESLGGAISSGEFGSMLREIFEPETATEFHFERWGNWHGHICYVYNYHVSKENSRWTIDYEHGAQTYRPAYSGLIYIERDAPVVIKLTLVAEGIPSSFPIQEARSSLEYEYQEISGQQFLLPVRSEMTMRDSKAISKNEVEFRNYRKYSAEAVIKFDTQAVADSAAPAAGRTPTSVAQLKQYIHSSLERKTADKQMVEHLKQCQLTERLSDPDLMEMINDGAGPETIETLKQMQEQSMNLPLPAPASKP